MSSVDCKELISDVAIKWLAEYGAEVFCAYCGYVFDEMPKLPSKCPKCGRKLTKLCMPIFEPRPRVRL
jgi:rubrerythrin